MAPLVRIPSYLTAILTAHVPLKLMNRRSLWTAYYIERDGLVGITAEASNLKIAVARVKGIAKRRGRLGRSLVAKHPIIPRLTGQPVGLLASFFGSLRRHSDHGAVEVCARLR